MKLTKCPLCGGKLYLDSLCQYSVIRTITKNGRISKNYKTMDHGSMEAVALYCENQDFRTDYGLTVIEPSKYSGLQIKIDDIVEMF